MRRVVDWLAAARLARLVTTDTFPPVKALRDVLVDRAGPESSLAELITCNWCAGFWISAGVVAARRWIPRSWAPLADALAMSMVVGLVAGWSEREGDPADVAEAIEHAGEGSRWSVAWGRDSPATVLAEGDLAARIMAAREASGGVGDVTLDLDGSGVLEIPAAMADEVLASWRARNRATMEQEQR